MKLLTINTHSLIEDDYRKKLDIFVDAIYRIRPDIITMQEVNQTINAPIICLGDEYNIRRDNHVYAVCKHLAIMGLDYSCIWRGIKNGYKKFDEGIAVMSRLPIKETKSFIISKTHDSKNWRLRRVLGVRTGNDWFYSVHMGRFDDTEEPFINQWQNFVSEVSQTERVWAMGDFNCDDESDGYKAVINSGWYDTYKLAEEKDRGITIRGNIDGWRDGDIGSMRIDYIFCNKKIPVKSSQVIFNGDNERVISDHFGVLVEV